jgi:hypothetical protein
MEKKLDALESLLAKMEKLLTKVIEENDVLRKVMELKEEEEGNLLMLKLNSQEQNHRSWSIVVRGLKF